MLPYKKKHVQLLFIYYKIKLRGHLISIMEPFVNRCQQVTNFFRYPFLKFLGQSRAYLEESEEAIKRIIGIFCAIMLLSGYKSSAQFVTWVFHTDLPFTQLENTAFKVAWNNMYSGKLNDIKNDREKTLASLMVVEEVQRNIFKTLSNVDDAVKDGKTMIAIGKKIPLIYSNLQKSAGLAVGKPYMITIVGDMYRTFYERILKLTDYLYTFVLSSDEKILIDPVRRHQFVYEIYSELSVLYQLSNSIVNQYQLHNLQDAIDKIVPLSTFYNVDKMLVNDVIRKIKLF
ncbi:MAG TPA: hypothetical protein VF421_02935 [Niabella sp.]